MKKIPQALELFVLALQYNGIKLIIHAVLNHVLFYLVQQRKRKKMDTAYDVDTTLLCYLHFLKEIAVGDDL